MTARGKKWKSKKMGIQKSGMVELSQDLPLKMALSFFLIFNGYNSFHF